MLRPLRRLVVEPNPFHTPAVEYAVDHRGKSLNLWLPAGGGTRVMDNWSSDLVRQFFFNFPYQVPTLLLIYLHRLLIEHSLDITATISRVVEFSTAPVVLIEYSIRIVDCTPHKLKTDLIILAS